MENMPRPDALFWAKVRKQDDGCWVWTGTKRKGYGRLGRKIDASTRITFGRFLTVTTSVPPSRTGVRPVTSTRTRTATSIRTSRAVAHVAPAEAPRERPKSNALLNGGDRASALAVPDGHASTRSGRVSLILPAVKREGE